MRRAALLACLLLLVGCQHAVGPGTPAGPPTVSVANGSDEPFHLSVFRSAPQVNGTTEVVTVGTERDFDGRVEAVVWNEASREQSIRVELSYLPANETLYRRLVLPAEKAVRFDVRRSGRYALSVTTNATTRTVPLAGDTFDCNDHTFGVRVGPDGNVSSVELATEVACVTPGQ